MTDALAESLAEFAEIAPSRRLDAIIDQLRRPIRIAVTGRDGVGRRTAASALRRRGVGVVGDERGDGAGGAAYDVLMRVVADTVKPEDEVALRRAGRPALIVLTKADLAGVGSDGPVAVARRRAAALRSETSVPVVPMIGLLANLEPCLNGDLITALESLRTHPADLSSVDAFVSGTHPVGPEVRARLLDTLDRFGIAHAVVALDRGMSPDAIAAYLHGLANLDEVLAALDAAAAPVRHRRVHQALAELRCFTIDLDGRSPAVGLLELLASDATALAVMAAAVDVVEAEGLSVDRGDTAEAHRARAVAWHRYGRGPVDALHRRCGADIARGSLRLLGPASP